MYSYNLIQWAFFFYFYCFFGWCFESVGVSVSSKKLVNRGFIKGPFLPLYGTGAIMMLLVSRPFQDNIVMVYISGCIGATVLEYVTGVLMEGLFKVRYWDYSHKKFQIQGHICLSSSLAWGFLTILMTEVVHKAVESVVLLILPQWLTAITLLLTAAIFADFALSFKAALDFRDVLLKLEKGKQEMLRLQKRLDVVIAVTSQDYELMMQGYELKKEEFTEDIHLRKEKFTEDLETRLEDLVTGIESKLKSIKKIGESNSPGYMDNVKEEIIEIYLKFQNSEIKKVYLDKLRSFYQKGLFRSNPTITSVRFREILEDLKRKIEHNNEDED